VAQSISSRDRVPVRVGPAFLSQLSQDCNCISASQLAPGRAFCDDPHNEKDRETGKENRIVTTPRQWRSRVSLRTWGLAADHRRCRVEDVELPRSRQAPSATPAPCAERIFAACSSAGLAG